MTTGMKHLAAYQANLLDYNAAKDRECNYIGNQIRAARKSMKLSLEQLSQILMGYLDMPVSDLPVSAGTGAFLDEGNFEMVSFPESSIPDGAEFGVRVSGDSMEPVYHDGQIVWVQQCETLRTGEVGVMIYDGQGYIKAYAEQEPDDPEAYLGSDGVRRMQPVMVSYNKAYAPKPASPELEFRIVGRVL